MSISISNCCSLHIIQIIPLREVFLLRLFHSKTKMTVTNHVRKEAQGSLATLWSIAFWRGGS